MDSWDWIARLRVLKLQVVTGNAGSSLCRTRVLASFCFLCVASVLLHWKESLLCFCFHKNFFLLCPVLRKYFEDHSINCNNYCYSLFGLWKFVLFFHKIKKILVVLSVLECLLGTCTCWVQSPAPRGKKKLFLLLLFTIFELASISYWTFLHCWSVSSHLLPFSYFTLAPRTPCCLLNMSSSNCRSLFFLFSSAHSSPRTLHWYRFH